MIKAIIFDFFGVICPDLYWYFLGKHVADLETKRDFFQELSNQHDQGLLPQEEFIRKISVNTGVETDSVLEEMNKVAVVDTELIEFIKKLKENYKIGVLSNSGDYFINKIFTENNLNNFFNTAIVSERVGLIKPDPRIFKLTLEKLGVGANEALFIDDRVSNTSVAEKLGIKSFVYTSVEKLKENLKNEGIVF